jgi:hypothetical protein
MITKTTNYIADVEEQLNALSLGDTFVKNLISPYLEGNIYQLVIFGFTAAEN